MGRPQPGACRVAKRVRVEIYNQTYNIGGELEESYVAELGAYVDAKMRAVAAATQTVDSLKVAVLAALAIADELHSLRREQTELEEPLRERAERCLALVERALKPSA
ncbi:MAG: cell division protein ZapA [Acidobacteria bacterium]|nr:cell division protein ZapA [Acidobacteriota bacterium]